jgi:hypothetical protein
VTHWHLSDRMPDVRHGLDAWTQADRLHLSTCADCAEEWRVVAAVPIPDLPVIGVEGMTATVLERLRREPKALPLKPRTSWRPGVIGLAAAAVLAIVFLLPRSINRTPVASASGEVPTMLPELDGLFESELESVLGIVTTQEPDPIGIVPRLDDLTDEELETLLEEVEG